MPVAAVIALLEQAAQAGVELYNDYEAGRQVLAESDAQAVHAQLLAVEAVTANLRTQVDAALAKAAQS